MIIDSIKLTNFGLYKGTHLIDLSPAPLSNKNVTVVSGQNGVGKSTLQEAIHLCLLGSLSIDTRVSEANYERYLLKRAYRGGAEERRTTSIELNFEFIKSGAPVRYTAIRSWKNNPNDPGEDIEIKENNKALTELNKKEKNLFLRELIQPGLAKVMFFDGEKLLSLYDENNLAQFIADSCRYLFGLNFVDLLHTDLNYYINKLQAQQDPSQSLAEILKIKAELQDITKQVFEIEGERSALVQQIHDNKQEALQIEKQISDQGRWALGTLEQLKTEQRGLEQGITAAKRSLVEVYSALGPFVFCRDLCLRLKERLMIERDAEKWKHASDLLQNKVQELEQRFNNPEFLYHLALSQASSTQLLAELRNILLETPKQASAAVKIHHELTDGERNRLLSWIDQVLDVTASAVLSHSEVIARNEERLKIVTKELGSFSKDDLIQPLLQQLQQLNKTIGSDEQKLVSLHRRTEEATRRDAFYKARLQSLEEKLVKEGDVDERLRLSSRTRLVLEGYAQQLMSRKLNALNENVLSKFNLLCRKESYLDELSIDARTFEIKLSRQQTVVEHAHLSAGEKQLLVISILWGLRELTNIALPLVIDTPLARLDTEHRKTFIEAFLPAIQPQVILIGTDMELAGDVIDGLQSHIAHQYLLTYNAAEQATQLTAIMPTTVSNQLVL